MGQYNKAVLTTAGEKLIARALAGEIKLNITKAKTSDFAYPENADLKRLTDMQGVRQTVCDPETVVFNETIIQTRVLFSNEDIASTYYIHNIGLYAMDGTNEVLFSIVTAEMPDEMPQYNGVASTSYIYNIQNVVQDAAQLNISVNPSGTATIQDVLERVNAIGGDISETVIETLDTVEDKYPIPTAGESVKRFFGKVLTFMKSIRPLTGDKIIYVSANTGSDTDGDGTQSNKYATITKALSTIPENLNGFDCIIDIGIGVYDESVVISNFINGRVQLRLSGNITVNNFTIQNAYAVIRTIGQSFSLTCNWLFVTDSGNALSLIAVNWNITGYKEYLTRNTSIIIDNTSNLTASGIIALTGNTDVAVFAVNNSRAGLGTIRGTGFEVGFYSYRNGLITCTVNNLIATRLYSTDNGGIIVKSSGAVIGTLNADANIYVSTTGSDTTGDGTSGNPFKTIQHTIDVLPKDLGGYFATINVASGIYPEDIKITGFSNGALFLYSATKDTYTDTCKVNSVDIKYCTAYVLMNGFNITTTTRDGFIIWGCHNVRLFYCQVLAVSSYGGFYFGESIGRVTNCKVANHYVVLSISNSQVYSGAWSAGSTGNSVGLSCYTGSTMYLSGAQPTATLPRTSTDGGQFVFENGTQISGLINAGLSCTWGTIEAGGYYRNGNLNGVAQIIVNLRIYTTASLTVGQQYSIGGFPTYSGHPNVAVTTHNTDTTSFCYLNNLGFLIFAPKVNINAGQIIIFSCTYIITNS